MAGSVLQGIDAALDGRAASAARARLAETPPTLAEAVWEPYAFEVTTIEASRSGHVRARLIDRAARTAWALEEPVVEQRRFRVASGRRSRDRGLLEGGGSDLAATADVAVWEQEGLRPSLAGLLIGLGRVAGPGTTVDGAELAAPVASQATPSGTVGSVEARVDPDGIRRYRLREAMRTLPLTPDQ